MNEFDADVIIVGAGPTGLMLAGELRLQGVSVMVLDRLTEPMRQSRALGFSARTIEDFDQRGLLPRFGEEVGVIPFGHFGGIPLDYRVLPGGSYGARGIPQSRTEAILAARAAELGAQVRRGHEVVGLEQSAGGVELTVDTSDGATRLRAAYVVGCDGARSAVRKLAGIGFPGTDPVIEMWLADVADCDLELRFSGERVPGGMVMVLPLGPTARRVAVYERKTAPGRQEPPTFTEVADAFERLTGTSIHDRQPMWVSWFTDASRQASEYRHGRVLLAGDAAHIHMPIGGQGMSAGVQDAVNLGWKLAAELAGHAPEGLLDTYHSERHPVAARVIANTLAQRILYLSDEDMQPLREIFADLTAFPDVQRHLVGMVTGLDIRYDVGPGDHPLLGERMPKVELDGGTTTFELLHSGRGVLLDLAGGADLGGAAGWADRVDTVSATPAEGSPLAGVEAVLVRPDGYIAWVGAPGDGGLTDALTRWFGQPA